MASSLNAQTITGEGLTKVWEHSTTYTTTETRSIGALGQTALVPNNTNGTLEVWDSTGKVSEYKVKEWLDAQIAAGAVPEGTVMGRGAAVDAVGNIILNLNFPAVTSYCTFLVIDSEGNFKYLPCELPGGVTLPEGAGRCDFLGDKQAGNVLTGNAFIVTCPNTAMHAIVFNIYEGTQEKDYSYALKIGDDESTSAWNTESTAIIVDQAVADADVAPSKVIARSRSINNFFVATGEEKYLSVATYTGENPITFTNATTTNFTAFKTNNKEYVVINVPDNDTRTHSWAIFDFASGEQIARWTMPTGEAANYMVGFASTVNEDGSVNIFQFNPGVRIAMYKFVPDASGVNAIDVDNSNAPIEYYNLQGIKVANPENGLFIKKQGSNVEKVVVK